MFIYVLGGLRLFSHLRTSAGQWSETFICSSVFMLDLAASMFHFVVLGVAVTMLRNGSQHHEGLSIMTACKALWQRAST